MTYPELKVEGRRLLDELKSLASSQHLKVNLEALSVSTALLKNKEKLTRDQRSESNINFQESEFALLDYEHEEVRINQRLEQIKMLMRQRIGSVNPAVTAPNPTAPAVVPATKAPEPNRLSNFQIIDPVKIIESTGEQLRKTLELEQRDRQHERLIAVEDRQDERRRTDHRLASTLAELGETRKLQGIAKLSQPAAKDADGNVGSGEGVDSHQRELIRQIDETLKLFKGPKAVHLQGFLKQLNNYTKAKKLLDDCSRLTGVSIDTNVFDGVDIRGGLDKIHNLTELQRIKGMLETVFEEAVMSRIDFEKVNPLNHDCLLKSKNKFLLMETTDLRERRALHLDKLHQVTGSDGIVDLRKRGRLPEGFRQYLMGKKILLTDQDVDKAAHRRLLRKQGSPLKTKDLDIITASIISVSLAFERGILLFTPPDQNRCSFLRADEDIYYYDIPNFSGPESRQVALIKENKNGSTLITS